MRVYLQRHVLHASGLGLYIYTGPRGEPPSERALVERRLARIELGSPELFCELSVGPGEATLGEVLARAVFPLDVRSGAFSVCDGYAEMDWRHDGYAHVQVAVPPDEHDVVVTAHRSRQPGADWALHFQLAPRSRAWCNPRAEQVVGLLFDPRWMEPAGP